MAYSKKTIKDVRELTEKYGVNSAARMLGKSLETVKRINRKYGEVDVIIDKNAHLKCLCLISKHLPSLPASGLYGNRT